MDLRAELDLRSTKCLKKNDFVKNKTMFHSL